MTCTHAWPGEHATHRVECARLAAWVGVPVQSARRCRSNMQHACMHPTRRGAAAGAASTPASPKVRRTTDRAHWGAQTAPQRRLERAEHLLPPSSSRQVTCHPDHTLCCLPRVHPWWRLPSLPGLAEAATHPGSRTNARRSAHTPRQVCGGPMSAETAALRPAVLCKRETCSVEAQLMQTARGAARVLWVESPARVRAGAAAAAAAQQVQLKAPRLGIASLSWGGGLAVPDKKKGSRKPPWESNHLPV